MEKGEESDSSILSYEQNRCPYLRELRESVEETDVDDAGHESPSVLNLFFPPRRII